MNSKETKLKFGVSKTAYKNMRKAELFTDSFELVRNLSAIKDAYKVIRKKRKAEIRKIQKKKHSDSLIHMRAKGKPRKRRDGKARGSVKPRSGGVPGAITASK
jgi:hypothetical protein